MNYLPFLGHKKWEAVQNDVGAKRNAMLTRCLHMYLCALVRLSACVHACTYASRACAPERLLAVADLSSNLCAKSNVVEDQLNVGLKGVVTSDLSNLCQ